MKNGKLIIAAVVFCAAVLTGFDIFYLRTVSDGFSKRNVTINRINNEVSHYISQKHITLSESENISEIINELEDNKTRLLQIGCSEKTLPDEIWFTACQDVGEMQSFRSDTTTYIRIVRDCDDDFAGIIIYRYRSDISVYGFIAANFAILLCCAFIVLSIIHINCTIMRPFRKFSEYPEHLSKGYTQVKLPETKNKNFGQFIWGMNMLTDILNNDRKLISKLEYERQTLLTSIAHSVKTPVTNIKLYSEAIETGLYSNNKTSPQDAEIAQKIKMNAEKIEGLTKELLETASSSVQVYTPEYSEFYLKELSELVQKQYGDKFKICRIPYKIECIDNPLIRSDKDGLMKIISQLSDNAIKYGNGKGITIFMERQDDCISISVKNKGELLPENELPFVFNSFWRGSNSTNADGNGIGLYVSRKIARSLGGDLYIRRLPESEEMEFLIIISL